MEELNYKTIKLREELGKLCNGIIRQRSMQLRNKRYCEYAEMRPALAELGQTIKSYKAIKGKLYIQTKEDDNHTLECGVHKNIDF